MITQKKKKMDSGSQQAASLTITVTRAVLPKRTLCKLEGRPHLGRPVVERRPFLLEIKLPEAWRVPLKDAREHREGAVSLSKAKCFLPKGFHLAKRLQTQIHLKEIYY